jgi:hypothetical protein
MTVQTDERAFVALPSHREAYSAWVNCYCERAETQLRMERVLFLSVQEEAA